MAKRTKRFVDAVEIRDKDYVVWDDELPGFGLCVFASGKRALSKRLAKSEVFLFLRGGRGTARKCVGLTGSMRTYAINNGIIEHNVAHGIRKPKDQVRDRRLSDDDYRVLGKMLREASEDHELAPTIAVTRLLALPGCRRGEILGLKWSEVDFENSCLRLADSKEGASTRPIGLPVIELLEERRKTVVGEYVFPGTRGSPGGHRTSKSRDKPDLCNYNCC